MKKNWIQGAISKPGALHRQLGVKQGQKIPPKKLAAAAKKGGVEGKRARLAQTLKGLHKKKMTQRQDNAYDRKNGIKEGSKRDMTQDKKSGVRDKKRTVKRKLPVPSNGAYGTNLKPPSNIKNPSWVSRGPVKSVQMKKTMCKMHKKTMCKTCK